MRFCETNRIGHCEITCGCGRTAGCYEIRVDFFNPVRLERNGDGDDGERVARPTIPGVAGVAQYLERGVLRGLGCARHHAFNRGKAI